MVELPFAKTLQILEEGVRKGGKILFFGNGGSAADAQHIAAELVIRYKDDRIPIPAISITTNASVITACGNDLGYEAIFSRQVEALARPSDVAVGISTSGNSRNVLAGLTMARAKGARTIGLTGANGANMQDLCDAVIAIPSTVTARIQEMHILIGHMWCKGLEQRLGLA
jgi:D-sedoheptulose 7-phosphate isomerase